VVYKKYGTPEVLQIDEIAKPAPKNDELLIKVYAAEVTKSDCEMRSFKFAVKWFWLPLRIALGIFKPKKMVLGGYFSGVVEAVGKDVSKFQAGDQVFGCTGFNFGAHAEYLSLPENNTIVSMPQNVSFEEAAATPLGGLNALHFLTKANIQSGEKILIIGAGGSIGTFGVQIAKTMGAEVTVIDSGIKEQMLRKLGATNFLDYTKSETVNPVHKFDVIFSMVANSTYSNNIKALKTNGRYLMANPRLSDMLRAAITSRFTDKTATFAFAGETEAELSTLKDMIEQNQIKPLVDKVYPFEQAVAAHHRVETETRLGAVIIKSQT
jgi:NADPH:quinone reductase-like Zn-dependent oxidoreductase